MAACTSKQGAAPPSRSASPATAVVRASGPELARLIKVTCRNDSHEVLLRTWHGIMPSRSGDISLIPTYPNFVSGGLSHSTPYDYTQDVPLFFYGPGYVRPGVYTAPASLTDIAPTEGALLKFPFHAPDGHALTSALLPEQDRPLPRLLVTLVWDSGGMDVINTWKKDLPYFRSLLPKGAWFTHATVGASPSNTPPGHAEIGTGAFPMHTGFVDDFVRIDGQIEDPTDPGPQLQLEPTLGDLYDRAMHNRPVVGAVVSLSAHILMMSHGSYFPGGDKDLAISRQFTEHGTSGEEAPLWTLADTMSPYFRFPAYANSLPPVSTYTRALDAIDGTVDGLWRGTPIVDKEGGFDTPARTPYQTRLIRAVLAHEPFGKDGVPDLLYVNYKAIDNSGHGWSVNSQQMSDTVGYQDRALRELVAMLNHDVGAGRWVLAITADHGTQRSPAVSHAFLIDLHRLEDTLQARFDTNGNDVPLVQKVRPTQIWLDPNELASNDVNTTEIASFILHLTQAQTIAPGATPDPATANDTVFASVLPMNAFPDLPCLPEAHAGG